MLKCVVPLALFVPGLVFGQQAAPLDDAAVQAAIGATGRHQVEGAQVAAGAPTPLDVLAGRLGALQTRVAALAQSTVESEDDTVAAGREIDRIAFDLDPIRPTDAALARQRMATVSALRSAQERQLPRLRLAWVKATHERFWMNDMTVTCTGRKCTTVEFVGGRLAANRNKAALIDTIAEAVRVLRFRTVKMKWFSLDDRPTTYEITTLGDAALSIGQ